MNRSPLSVLIAAALALCLQLAAQEGPREEDFLIFDKIEEDQRAVPVKPAPPPAESAPAFQRPLPGGARGSLRTILLDVPDKSFATGRVSVLSASATQRGAVAEPAVQFEDATVSLQASLDKATVSLLAANPEFPDGVTLTVKVEGGYGGHEHDAAAAATAILLESIGTGRAIDTDAALLGGVDEKGRITGVQRLATRLRTLEGVAPPVIGVPMVSEVEVRDIALMNELDVLVKQQIVSLVTLDDARAITLKERPEKVARAFALFEGVRQAAATAPLTTLLKNPKFLQRLKEITGLMPNHLSAKLLLQAASNKVPGRVTFATSRQAILKAIKPFVNVTSTNRPAKEIQTVATEGGNVLLRMQPKIHPAAERYLVAMKAYLRSVSNFLDVPNTPQHAVMRNRAVTEMNKLLGSVQAEKEKLDKAEGSLE